MKTFQEILLISILILGLTTLNSCKKEELTQEEMTNLILDESEIAIDYFDDALENYDFVNTLQFKKQCPPGCPAVTCTIDEETCTYNFVLDFGTEGCEGRHGWLRKGKMTINVTGCHTIVCTVTFDQYYVNGYLIEGTKTITLLGPGSAQLPAIKIEISGSVTDPEGKVTTLEAEMTREWIEGYETLFEFEDDVFSTSGSASGVCSEGTAFDMNITSPLIKARSCKWIQQGEVSLVYGDNTIIKNYGDGTCDSLATVNINGEIKEIVLKHGRKHN